MLGRAGGRIGTDSKVPIIEALRDITLSLRKGARVALVGHNGAGKTTLLRLMSGIYEPTRGRASVVGKVAPIFDLAVGMDPEISGLENILIRGLFLGMTRKQMESRVDDIAEFTELGDYLSMPLRTYSTGMRVRLALGVVTSIDPEILLLDEGIGAVDAEFLHKARTRLFELVDRSGILVFASHSDEFLADLCDTAIWMEHGRSRSTARCARCCTTTRAATCWRRWAGERGPPRLRSHERHFRSTLSGRKCRSLRRGRAA